MDDVGVARLRAASDQIKLKSLTTIAPARDACAVASMVASITVAKLDAPMPRTRKPKSAAGSRTNIEIETRTRQITPHHLAGREKRREKSSARRRGFRTDGKDVTRASVMIRHHKRIARQQRLHGPLHPVEVECAHACRLRFQTGTAVRVRPTSQRRPSRNMAGSVRPAKEIAPKKVIPASAI